MVRTAYCYAVSVRYAFKCRSAACFSPNTPAPIAFVVFDRDGTVLYGLGRDFSVWKAILRGPRRRAVR